MHDAVPLSDFLSCVQKPGCTGVVPGASWLKVQPYQILCCSLTKKTCNLFFYSCEIKSRGQVSSLPSAAPALKAALWNVFQDIWSSQSVGRCAPTSDLLLSQTTRIETGGAAGTTGGNRASSPPLAGTPSKRLRRKRRRFEKWNLQICLSRSRRSKVFIQLQSGNLFCVDYLWI